MDDFDDEMRWVEGGVDERKCWVVVEACLAKEMGGKFRQAESV
jgi:hypothetical protein